MTNIKLSIKEVTLIIGRGRDDISFLTTLPDDINGNLSMDFKVPAGSGVSFLKEHFNIIPDRVVDLSKNSNYKFSEKENEN